MDQHKHHMASAYELVSVESRSLPFQGSLMQAKPGILLDNGTLSAGTRKTAHTQASLQPQRDLLLQVVKSFKIWKFTAAVISTPYTFH